MVRGRYADKGEELNQRPRVAENAVSELQTFFRFLSALCGKPGFSWGLLRKFDGEQRRLTRGGVRLTSYPFESFDAKKTSAQGFSTRWGSQVQVL